MGDEHPDLSAEERERHKHPDALLSLAFGDRHHHEYAGESTIHGQRRGIMVVDAIAHPGLIGVIESPGAAVRETLNKKNVVPNTDGEGRFIGCPDGYVPYSYPRARADDIDAVVDDLHSAIGDIEQFEENYYENDSEDVKADSREHYQKYLSVGQAIVRGGIREHDVIRGYDTVVVHNPDADAADTRVWAAIETGHSLLGEVPHHRRSIQTDVVTSHLEGTFIASHFDLSPLMDETGVNPYDEYQRDIYNHLGTLASQARMAEQTLWSKTGSGKQKVRAARLGILKEGIAEPEEINAAAHGADRAVERVVEQAELRIPDRFGETERDIIRHELHYLGVLTEEPENGGEEA
jgi:hypothetical protein